MAKKTVVRVFDDIDGAELDEYETVKWALDGKSYEFDTSPEHGEQFRDHVATYVAASRSASAQPRRRSVPSRSTRHVREWAISNGYSVSDRGRIPQDVEAAYDAAH